jgi:hypothetical protein
MDISKYIPVLLKLHDCVIIPDFGGFIASYVPSGIHAENKSFLAPAKTIFFNPKIHKDDGLLINHIVENEKITYKEASLAVSRWVSYAYEFIQMGKKLVISNLGVIELDTHGSFVFNLEQENHLAQVYGLGDVTFPKLLRPAYIDNFRQRPAIRAIGKRKDALRIAAGIALVVSLSLLPGKFLKDSQRFQSSGVSPIASPIQTELSLEAEETVNEETVIEEVKREVIVDKTAMPYVLVGGSFASEENARTYLEQLLKEGNHAEMDGIRNNLYRVVIDSYPSRDEALAAMEIYREKHPGSQAWVSVR